MTSTTNATYNVIEDDGGNLLLTTFEANGNVTNGCYPRPEDMGACLSELIRTNGDMSDWDNLLEDAQAEYDMEENACLSLGDVNVVCDESGLLNVQRWGNAAHKAFAVIDHRGNEKEDAREAFEAWNKSGKSPWSEARK